MTYLEQAEAFLRLRDLSQAEACFAQASAETGGASSGIDAGLWQLNMLRGDFEQAWQASDRIRTQHRDDPHRFWNGEAITGRDLIVRSLHGLGDAVQMFQYAPQLRLVARSVTWQMPPHLVELAQCFEGVERVITWEEPCAWDMQVEITELPYLFRTTMNQLPLATSYLNVKADRKDNARPRIGLVWAAGHWNKGRSIPLCAFDFMLERGTCDFISLQGGSNVEHHPRLSAIEDGLLPLAKTIAGLDLVITVDTLAAHLAGALGVPAYVLLEYAADWRWMTARDDSPWYPSLRLFRQPAPGDWETPLQAVDETLGALAR